MIVYQNQVNGLALLEAEHHAPITRDANAPLARAVALEGMQPEARRVAALPGCAASCRRNRIRRSRGTRPAGSRAASSRSCSARSPLCLIFMIHCSAPRYTPQSPAVSSRPATTLRSGGVCTPRRCSLRAHRARSVRHDRIPARIARQARCEMGGGRRARRRAVRHARVRVVVPRPHRLVGTGARDRPDGEIRRAASRSDRPGPCDLSRKPSSPATHRLARPPSNDASAWRPRPSDRIANRPRRGDVPESTFCRVSGHPEVQASPGSRAQGPPGGEGARGAGHYS